jgi:hypothetical protein
VREQDRVDPLLEAGAVADEVEAEAGPLPLGAHLRVGQPDRRHQLPPGELGQHPGVDPVGLAGQRRQPLHLQRIGDLHLPAGQLQPVVDEAGAGHRLDRCPHRPPVAADPLGEPAKTIRVWGSRAYLERLPTLVQQVEVETLTAEIQTSVQH